MPIHTHPFQNKLERRGEERRGECHNPLEYQTFTIMPI